MQRFRLHGAHQIALDHLPAPTPGAGDVLVAVSHVGICGSDKHYFAHGRCGAFVPKAPFALGHEFSGIVTALGDGVAGLRVGDRVAVDPLQACGQCPMCRGGHANLCPSKRYMGSAAAWPHVDGAMGEAVCVPASNVYHLPDAVSLTAAALIEPSSVAYHAVRRAGPIAGTKVLVIGGGAIGQLILRLARALGARHTSLADPLAYNRTIGSASGADLVFTPEEAPPDVDYDVVWEAAGAESALSMAIQRVRKGGVIVQVGTLPDRVNIPANLIMAKEVDLRGSIQFDKAFPDVIALLEAGRLRVDDLVTQRFPFEQAPAALDFALASRESIKILIDLPHATQETSQP